MWQYKISYPALTEMKFLINIEAQKSSDPDKLGYHLENRMAFYMARMISAQKYTEFYHSDYDSLKKVRSIWICMDNDKDGDSIEEISFGSKTVFGNTESTYNLDLMKGIVINIRSGENIEESKNVLIDMLEKLISNIGLNEKKRILADKYGMVMTTEFERKVNTMCNWSEFFMEQWMEQGLEQGIKTERLNAIERMLKAGATKAQILSYGYTEDELAEKEDILYANI